MSADRAAVETKSRFRRICVFCGSRPGKKASYQEAALQLANELVQNDLYTPLFFFNVHFFLLLYGLRHIGLCFSLLLINQRFLFSLADFNENAVKFRAKFTGNFSFQLILLLLLFKISCLLSIIRTSFYQFFQATYCSGRFSTLLVGWKGFHCDVWRENYFW